MASEAESARKKAALYLALALEARALENFELAELLTDAATAAFDKAEAQEAADALPPVPAAQSEQPPVHQQQQAQPNDGPDDRDPDSNE
jgi:hypothetical protein